MFYERYEQLVGSVVTVKVSCLTKNYTIVIDEKNNELFLPIKDQLHQDNFAKGNIIKALVVKIIVKRGKPVVLLSRTEPLFLEKLLSFEIPEILDGLVIIKKIARIPGEKSKVVVESIDGRIDPVGTCIGIRGSRISGVSKELGNESIDIIQYSDNQQLFISRVLGSVFIRKLDILQSQIIIYVEKEQMAKAIGKNAYNIRLLKKLLNQDVNIVEYNEKFENEKNINVLLEYIDEWVVIELKKAGFFTVESVLSVSPKELEEKADLETETVNDIYKILEKINKD
jgi:N utilization substance protein A